MTKKKAKKKPTATPEPDPPQDASRSLQPDLRLPPRLFATDRFPTKRLNIYSSPEILPFLRHVLRDTKEFQIIRESCFGKLFDIPARQCPVSAKLIHSFLTRQLLCLPKNTLWSVFGGNPLRYGLQGFGTVTGLNCASFPEGYHPDIAKSVVAGKDEVWKRLFGKKKIVTIAELCRMLEKEKKMDHWKKIRIALIIIVDGVLIAHKQQARATPRYVMMLKNLTTFFAFPWGRESFLKTISCMKPPKIGPQKRPRSCFLAGSQTQAKLFQTSRLPFDTSIGGISRHPPFAVFHSCSTRPAYTDGLRRWLSTTTQLHQFPQYPPC
ncbi:hypothetical protein YC2023_078711 [Brassica napus]